MAKVCSIINMKGGVGKTTLSFNLVHYAASKSGLRVLAIDLDPQSNLSQCLMGTEKYYEYLKINSGGTVFNIFQQFSTPQPLLVTPENTITRIEKWADGSSLDLIPSCLELSWVLKNPTEKSHLLSQFIDNVVHDYDLIVIDCAPTESILTTAAYLVSQYIFVPVKPEFLATIGLPMFAQSIKNHKRAYPSKEIKMGGVIFNGATRGKKSPEQIKSIGDVKEVAATNN